MDKSIIPIKVKVYVLNLWAVLALTGALFIGVFYIIEKLGFIGFIEFLAVALMMWRWQNDVERAKRNNRRCERTRKTI